jgi:hypothetical protein
MKIEEAMDITKNQSVHQDLINTAHLKDVYEQSLAMLSDFKQNSKTLRSAVPLHIDAASLQKRALDDAAKALAALWKVPSPGRLHSPIYGR